MTSVFKTRLNPQRSYFARTFANAVRKRSLTSSDLPLLLVHLRESDSDPRFREWGSSIAHIRRDQGSLWESAVSIWATHVYYTNLNRRSLRLDPLPANIFLTVRHYLETASEHDLRNKFSDLFRAGIARRELLATLDHLYCKPKKKSRLKEQTAFYHLSSKADLEEEDKQMIQRIILASEDYALRQPPQPLSEMIKCIEDALKRQNALDGTFDDPDRKYLQLHCLVSLHNTRIVIAPESFKELTGNEMGEVEPMAFVSCFENNVSLDLGFFELDEGKYIEPAPILSPLRNLVGGRLEQFYYPLILSDLPNIDYIVESDENIRLSLYNHPLRVVKHKGKHVIFAEERESTRYAYTKSRYRN